MAKFMLILGGADLDKRSSNPNRTANVLEQYMAWVGKLSAAGRLAASYKLYDQTGARLSVRGGEVVDGPFVETKEAVGGIFVIEADSLEHATATARDCPVLLAQNGYVEVRAVER